MKQEIQYLDGLSPHEMREQMHVVEVALVFAVDGSPIHWHEPQGSSGGAIPDSRDLWDILWKYREVLGGVAHTHPWTGEPSPSGIDVTTWAAIEKGLGKRLVWPIVTMDHIRYFGWNSGQYVEIDLLKGASYADEHRWRDNINELRRRSRR